ncbi:MAG: NUDIX domain-containing protein [Patescibacteria group bacterium]
MKIGAFGIILDKNKRVLLCHRRDYDKWNLPGGGVKNSESPWDGVRREVKEETGLNVEIIRISNIYFKPKEREIIFVFLCKVKDGKLKLNDEADAIRYFDFKKIPQNTVRRHVERIRDALKGKFTMKIQ